MARADAEDRKSNIGSDTEAVRASISSLLPPSRALPFSGPASTISHPAAPTAARPPPLHPPVPAGPSSHGRMTSRQGAYHSRGGSMSGLATGEESADFASSELGPDTSVDLTPQASGMDVAHGGLPNMVRAQNAPCVTPSPPPTPSLSHSPPYSLPQPVVRIGHWEELGGRSSMEDAACLIQDLSTLLPTAAPLPPSWRQPAGSLEQGRGNTGEAGEAVRGDRGERGGLDESALSEDLPSASGNGNGNGEEEGAGGADFPRAFMAVFDGHHGAGAAQWAAERLARHLVACACFPEDMEGALRAAFLATDEELRGGALGEAGAEAGSTGLACVVWGSQLWLANCGDCRAVLSKRGKAQQLTGECGHEC